MIGIGPFITIPAFIATMGGPQAMIAWVIAAVLVICDGLVWSELGAALPGSGGSNHFLREIFGRYTWGRLLPFLFIWQFLVSGALEMASGYIGSLGYLEYVWPGLRDIIPEWGGSRWLAAAASILVTVALCQNIRRLGWLSIVFVTGTLVTVAVVIVSGLANFQSGLLTLPPGGIVIDAHFAKGLGAAMLIAIYDYLGYYNICHLGDEVVEPAKIIPRAVLISVILVAGIYLTMNVAIIGVIPWQEAMQSKNVAALFMERLYGRSVAVGFTALILWTSLACLFALMLGYSRIPYAAARRGDFFRVFGRLHPRDQYPVVSLAVLGGITSLFCFFDLTAVINAAVAVRILVQFVAQIIGLHLVHTTRPDIVLPFRMWLYPLPSIIALGGWLFVFCTTDRSVLLASLGVLGTGCAAFVVQRMFVRNGAANEHSS
jgi:amino acid transporter